MLRERGASLRHAPRAPLAELRACLADQYLRTVAQENKMNTRRLCAAALLLAASSPALADERTEYNRRAAERDVHLFDTLDRNTDGMLTRDEVRGDLNLGPRFDDVDINRDGVITREELERYIERRYGMRAPRPGQRDPVR
jgi:hypothetical protein